MENGIVKTSYELSMQLMDGEYEDVDPVLNFLRSAESVADEMMETKDEDSNRKYKGYRIDVKFEFEPV